MTSRGKKRHVINKKIILGEYNLTTVHDIKYND